MIASYQLKAVLRDYADSPPGCGLCSAAFAEGGFKLSDELGRLFRYCGLNEAVPFNDGIYDYVQERARGRMSNQHRRLFIERALEDRLNEYLKN